MTYFPESDGSTLSHGISMEKVSNSNSQGDEVLISQLKQLANDLILWLKENFEWGSWQWQIKSLQYHWSKCKTTNLHHDITKFKLLLYLMKEKQANSLTWNLHRIF